MFFTITFMLYLVWCKSRTNPDSLWSDLPYKPRDYMGCERLVDYYEGEWGNLYSYQICRVGTTPKGMCQPCYVGIN